MFVSLRQGKLTTTVYKRGKRLPDGSMWVQDHDGRWMSLKEAAEIYSRDQNTYSKARG